jgi:integrase
MATIRKIKSGLWQAIVRKKNYPHICKSFIEKKSASRWAKDIEIQMDKKVFEDYSVASNTTLKEILLKYRDEIVINHKARISTTHKLNLLIRNKISHSNLMQLRSSHIYKLKNEMTDNGKSPKTISDYINLISAVWNTAKREWGIVLPPENPTSLVTKIRVNNYRDVTLTDEEINRLLKCADTSKPHSLSDLIRLAIYTSARINEILTLKRCDVDFKLYTATFRDTKNNTDRVIPLRHEVVSILKKYPFGQNFFNTPYSSFRFYWKQAKRKAQLPKLNFHDLRSVAITRMLLSGMTIPEVCTVSGHKDWSVMQKRYARIKPEQLIDKLNKVPNINLVS